MQQDSNQCPTFHFLEQLPKLHYNGGGHVHHIDVPPAFDWVEEYDDEDEEKDEGYLPEDNYYSIEYESEYDSEYDQDSVETIYAAHYSDASGFEVSFSVEWFEGEVAIVPSHVGPSTDFVALREAAKRIIEDLGL